MAFDEAAGPHVRAVADLGATFDHFAIGTRRIRDALPLWQDTLGGEFTVGADNAEIGWRTVRLRLGDQQCVELIEPLRGSTFFDGFFRRHPSGGLHHVTFLVDDIEAAYTHIEARGYEPFGADGQWYQLFVHPRQAGGVLVQLMRRRAVSEPVTPPMTLADVLAGRGFHGTGIPSP
jgi:methylmalonyl-CoA/ethylmalonyl-CoA epimerase